MNCFELPATSGANDGTKRLAYQLTKQGRALQPVLEAVRDWGLAWDKETRVMLKL